MFCNRGRVPPFRQRHRRGAATMQFYLNGYKPGDPFVEDPHPSVAARPDGLPEEVDVLIVGCGPAGLVLAAQLADFPDIRTAVIDRKDGPLEVGQADGVACRSVEMFEAFGLADQLIHEGYGVNEVAFWRPDPADREQDHAHRPHPGRRGGPVRDAARDRQPGADARLPPRPHGALGQQARAALRPARHRHPDRRGRRGRVPGDGHRAAPEGPRGDRGDLDDPGQVRRRLRRVAQRRPHRDRPRAGRRRR